MSRISADERVTFMWEASERARVSWIILDVSVRSLVCTMTQSMAILLLNTLTQDVRHRRACTLHIHLRLPFDWPQHTHTHIYIAHQIIEPKLTDAPHSPFAGLIEKWERNMKHFFICLNDLCSILWDFVMFGCGSVSRLLNGFTNHISFVII